MNKLITCTLLVVGLIWISIVHAKETQLELEVKQRDIVIKELAELALFNFKGHTKKELIKFLQTHPKAIATPDVIGIESNYIFWGDTIKFQFKNDKLINVYW